MFGISLPEVMLIMVLALLVFGPERIPKVSLWLGRGIRQMRNAATELRQSLELEELRSELREAVDGPSKNAPREHQSTWEQRQGSSAVAASSSIRPAVGTFSKAARELERKLSAQRQPCRTQRVPLNPALPAQGIRKPLPAPLPLAFSHRLLSLPPGPTAYPGLRRSPLPPSTNSQAQPQQLPVAGTDSARRVALPKRRAAF
ncbi:MAG: twin-arginine translocase TatA/TatE family subunit [Myxococcota bacterium]|jgi:Sec-independent protein translocase protein TatA|nr:twin-arginine translocase TatA/TatE family subunit [Myxococcota bacterium]